MVVRNEAPINILQGYKVSPFVFLPPHTLKEKIYARYIPYCSVVRRLSPLAVIVGVCLSVGTASKTPSLSIIGWCCSIPRTSALLISRLCSLHLVCYFSLSDDGYGLPSPLLPPSQILLGSLSPAVCPFPLFLFPLPSLRLCHSVAPPPQQRLIPRHPSGGLLWRTPPVDSTQCPLLGSRAPHADVFPTCADGATWIGCGLRVLGDSAPRDCP